VLLVYIHHLNGHRPPTPDLKPVSHYIRYVYLKVTLFVKPIFLNILEGVAFNCLL
jgi:hypothetical protein